MRKKILHIVLLVIIFILGVISFLFFRQLYYLKRAQNLNLILISVDTLRPDHMGVYGYNKNTTPNIDKWAKKAAVFTNAYTIVPETYPSFTALMTGKYPFATRIINHLDRGNKDIDPIASQTDTLVKILNKNNMKTAAFLISGELDPSLTHINEGFDEFHFLYHWKTNIKDKNDFMDTIIKWVQKNKNEHFFLWLHLIDPHYPYDPPDSLQCVFDKANCETISQTTPTERENTRRELMGCKSVPKKTVGIYKTLYDGEIAYSDELLGKLFNALNKARLTDKSVVVLYGDHGEGFDHNFNFHHPNVLYNSTIRIPLIIKYPFADHQQSNLLIQNTDILPTVLHLLGKDAPNNAFTEGLGFDDVFQPLSLKSIMYPTQKRPYAYAMNYDLSKFSIMDGKYKYILSTTNTCLYNNQKEELYDYQSDPQEEQNIINQQKARAENLKIQLLKHFSLYNLPAQSSQDTQYNNPTIFQQNQETLDKLKSMGY